ncbi:MULTISPECIES: hypothetical protein [Acinetobacter]|jgi:hypothetical protein|uniref:Uncharacterized protein n=11 Tax=Acinetobacter TaxID=469 RepID=N9C2P1_9GAMM|nr:MULTISPECIES: hypothetical protein [Acinetobacter]EXB46127.1 hypothetical protein J522_3045 [Acinetobacter baumannii 146457]EKU54233.1 hypothetical protein ACINWC323_2497 [Acinetobacter sp. WC-323]ENU43668.1 hypothetical protein F985_01592 [Acinetobacter seifertii]ENV11406.1 hypothetical protein F966_00188 [Acinetobacter higginsii]ENV79796.1 hypothetical protein F942_01528 [Acinetobacter ursingii ANC 3649]
MTHYSATPQAHYIPQTPIIPFMLDVNTHLFLGQSIQNAAQIENGKLAVMDKRSPKCLDKNYRIFLNSLPWLHYHRLVLHGFQLNPYWAAIFDTVGFSHYGNMNYLVENAELIHDQFKHKFLKRRIALEYTKFIEPINESIKFQKALFKRCLDKHKQINCMIYDLPCMFTIPLQFDAEVKLPKLASKWLERLHQSEELAGKLYDVQWRIVKSLNGFYSVHAIIYVIGDECKYSDFILRVWRGACLHKGHELVQGSPYLVWEKHCYFADSDMRSYWSKQLEFLNGPLKLYRYMSQHISYLWQSYTGNIPAK